MDLRRHLKRLITSERVLGGTFFASLAESTLVPIPLEAVLIPAMQANRPCLWRLAGAALAGCLVGALLGYAAGYWLFDLFGRQLVAWVGDPEQFEAALKQIRNHGFWFVLSVGITPIPFQIAMLAAGAIHYALPGYLAATVIACGIRYYGLALGVWKFGDQAQALFERHRRATLATLTVAVIAAWGLAITSGG